MRSYGIEELKECPEFSLIDLAALVEVIDKTHKSSYSCIVLKCLKVT